MKTLNYIMGRKLYRNKYSIGSRRMPGWDYTRKAYYSITINSKKKGNIFGEVIDGKMNLNVLGKIANTYAIEISRHFPHTKLHAHMVMPDHVHILLEIVKKPEEKIPRKEKYLAENGKTEQCSVSGSDIGNGENIVGDGNSHIEMEHCSISPS